MNEKDLPTGEGEEFESSDPDTNTDDEPETPSFPAPEPAGRDEPEAAAPVEAPPAPAGPRAFPEHYLLLLGSAMCLAATLSVWRRMEIYGYTLTGAMSIKRTFLMALSIYCVGVGISNIATGRLRGMFLSFITGVTALWLGIKEFLAFNDPACKFKGWSDVKQETGSFQVAIEKWLGQWGPGVWMSTIGGAIIVFVFLKAIFGGGKQKDAAPPPPQRRRGRR